MTPGRSRGGRSIIYLEDVTVDYDGFTALRDLNFYMDYTELRVVIGPNGAGKTTLLDVVSGRVKPARGRVVYGQDHDLKELSEHEIAALGVGRKFQTPTIFPSLSVYDNLDLSRRRRSKGVFATLLSAREPGARETVLAILEQTGLQDRHRDRAGALSHGEKQWLELGMAIVQECDLLLVDEPVAGMTDEETERTAALLRAVARDRAVLVIEHDMAFVRSIARTVTVLHEGTVLCEGTIDQVQRDPRVMEIYLGRQGARDAAH